MDLQVLSGARKKSVQIENPCVYFPSVFALTIPLVDRVDIY